MTARKDVSQPIEVTASVLAALVGVDRRTVSRWLAEGLPAARDARGLRIDVGAAVRWIRVRDLRDAEERLAAQRARLDPESGRARKVLAEALLREMDVRERAGLLMLKEDVDATWAQAIVAFREAVLSITGHAVQSGVIPPAKEPALDELCREALTALGAWMTEQGQRDGAAVSDARLNEEDEK
jgi:phage terminase Nu1 subunit (DNA packaging protein)